VTLGITTSNSKRLNSPPRQLASEAAFVLKAGVESGSVGETLGTTTSNSKRLNSPPRQLASEAAFDLKAGVESGSVDVMPGTATSNSPRLNSTPRQLASDAAFNFKAGVETGTKKRRKMKTCGSVQPSSPAPSATPSKQPTISRYIALRNMIGSNYADRPFDFGPTTNQYAALELLVNSDPGLVPIPVESNGEYLLLQRYVLVLLYLYTNGDMWWNALGPDYETWAGRWLADEAGLTTCNWNGVTCPDGSSIEGLDRTYNAMKREPVPCNTRSSLTHTHCCFVLKKSTTTTFQEAFLLKLDF
jgi:hypothetical protein